MLKVYQQRIDKDKGDCAQAVIASIFEKSLEEVPKFIESENFNKSMNDYLNTLGYQLGDTLWNPNYSYLSTPTFNCFNEEKYHEPVMMATGILKELEGVNGFLIGTVLSPKYFNWNEGFHKHHAVVINNKFEIVHDPNPEYANILSYPLARLLGYSGIICVEVIEKIR